jgi:tripartite-type tricarboxylate transporter receptor subunit TctC
MIFIRTGYDPMKILRREFLSLTAGAALSSPFLRSAVAQGYPSGPVRLIVGFAAGGSTDTVARLVGQGLSERLGQAVVIENRPGAATNIATELVVKSPPDGMTLLMVAPSTAINATLYDKLNFVFLRDMVPVASMMQQPQIMLVHPSLPARSVAELIAYAKANPGRITIASAGVGSSGHLAGELFKMMTGIDLLHVPYRGAAPALTDLIGGQVQMSFAGVAGSIEHVRAGSLRPLAVTTASRLEVLPEIPTVGETVTGYEASDWFGVAAPKNTPQAVVDRLNKEVATVLADPKIKARFADLGGNVLTLSPSAFGELIANDTEKWGKVIRAANIKPE